jgi:hypothetical protein
MDLSAAMIARAKPALICTLALLLLVTPVCGALCNANACDLAKPADKSRCHESTSATASERANRTWQAERNCGLQDLLVALPTDFRSSRPDFSTPANATPATVHVSFELAQPFSFFDSYESAATDTSPGTSSFPAIPLRI